MVDPEPTRPAPDSAPPWHDPWASTVPLSGDGAITSFTVIRVAPRGHAGDAPYAIAAVQLTEGVSVLGRVVDVPLETLAIGLKVRFRPLAIHDRAAIGFGPG